MASSTTLPQSALPPVGKVAAFADPVSIDPLAALRQATGALHDHLDSRLPLSRDHAGPADYRLHLALVGDWLAQIDALGLPAGDLPARWTAAQAQRHARIAADLEEFGPRPPATPVGAAPPGATPGEGFGWGVAYVVEGSQLGGAMLYRRLRERLAPHALAYLQGDGAGGGWPRFTAALRAAVRTAGQCEHACDGARWAFADLAGRFERAGALA